MEWRCHYCNKNYKGSHTRHLIRISCLGIKPWKEVKQEQILEMKRVFNEAELKLLIKKAKNVPLPTLTTTAITEVAKKRKGEGGNTIEKAFNHKARDHLHALIARMFYTASLPFNLTRNLYFIQSYTYAANHAIGGYLPPITIFYAPPSCKVTRHALRTCWSW